MSNSDHCPNQTSKSNPIGAVLVVGGGIAGLQASRDLTEAGFKVYLVEEKPALGGLVAQFDKTFPTNTNDCILCITTPKLTEVGRYHNCWNIYHRSKQCAMTPELLETGRHIEVITGASVESISGEPGHFKVQVRQLPRFVDPTKCAFCGDCSAACPVEVPDEFNAGLSKHKAIYTLYPQATPGAYTIQKRGTAPCRNACPIHQRAQGYIALIREKRYEDAYRAIKEDNPFPSVCGRICNHRCEDECTRGRVDEPVSIMALKRFVADQIYARERAPVEPAKRTRPERIAVVGSGPAGLTAAQDLVRMGYGVTVFEALPVAGGMMRVGVPEYRLPRQIVEREIQDILDLGVELRLNTRVEDVESLFAEGYKAVFLAIGAHQGRKLPIPGADLPDVWLNTDFLRRVALGEKMDLSGRRVLVLGGGNVAIDVARTAVRFGAAEVSMACLESCEMQPAHRWEIEEAQAEGVVMYNDRTFKEILSENGRVTGVRVWNVHFRGFTPQGIDMDEFPETEHILPCDLVIFAIGQAPDTGFLSADGDIKIGRGRTIQVDANTLMTTRPGVFAGGDAVTGTAFVVEAIAAGHKAARSIDRYIRGEELGAKEPVLQPVVEITEQELAEKLETGQIVKRPRVEKPQLPVSERVKGFAEVDLVLTEEQALAEAERCLSCGICSECLECVYACKTGAPIHEMQENIRELEVGAVVLTPGAELTDAWLAEEYGFGRWPNVLTSIEFERLLSPTGPYGGRIQRPSDGKEPHKIAWLQCVGSREPPPGREYCSSVCCMSAIKEAILAKEYLPAIEPSIFFRDIRTFGKDFERYYENARRDYGIRPIRCSAFSLEEVPGNHNLLVRYTDEMGQTHEEEFDLVVLSVGFQSDENRRLLAERLGVKLNQWGFCETGEFSPTTTSRPGIFVAGTFKEPKDIPEAIVEASSAAADASRLLAAARGTLIEANAYPPERDVTEEEPRVGVFICHCGINIGGVVNVTEVVEYATKLPGVAYADQDLYVCSQDSRNKIRDKIKEHHLNRLVVASCTPRTHEPLFRDTIRSAGLNPSLFEMANIREQSSWAHEDTPVTATEKAKELVAMAVAKARALRPVRRTKFEPVRSALVIGGGIAGMTAALSIAEQGYPVHLVEREPELGGHLRHVYHSLNGEDPQALLHQTIAKVSSHPRISVYTSARVESIGGYAGRYETIISGNGGRRVIEHGAIVVATGAQAAATSEYLYGQDEHVLTQSELEERLAAGNIELLPDSDVVMIQCVGSRDERHPYCSRICCEQAVKNAIKIKQHSPKTSVYILYRDISTYGFKEIYYHQAQEMGVVFMRYEPEAKPRVFVENGRLCLEAKRPGSDDKWMLYPQYLILSTGIVPHDNEELARLLKVPLNQDGFFLEAHPKLRPLDFATDGIYLCGLAHSPQSISESIAQANGAALRAVRLLSKEAIEAAVFTATVNERLCAGCGLCVALCPSGARRLDEERHVAEVIDALCQGCGACSTACPNGASQQYGFEKRGELAKIEMALG